MIALSLYITYDKCVMSLCINHDKYVTQEEDNNDSFEFVCKL